MLTFDAIRKLIIDAESVFGDTIPKSEFYNETWMLRLTLALLSESVEGECERANKGFIEKFGEKKRKDTLSVIDDIRKAVKAGWISEGGLDPVFKREHTTWTDASLGKIALEDGHRKIKVNADGQGKYDGIIVIEAKMGSDLSSRIKNSEKYNQVARNIACLAKLINKHTTHIDVNMCRFVVFAPRGKIEKWARTGKSPKDMIDNANKTIEDEQESKDGNKGRKIRDGKSLDKILEIARSIQARSCVVSWEDILDDYMNNCIHINVPDLRFLKQYYYTCLAAMPKF